MQVVRGLYVSQVARDAVAADLVVALGQRADDRGLVRKILIERAEGDAGPLDQLAHAEGFGALFGEQLGGTPKDALVALATAFLHRNEAGDAARRALRFPLPCHAAAPLENALDDSNTRVYRF